MENLRITGNDAMGNGAIVHANITIKNPSNISVLVDDLPIVLYYNAVKVTDCLL